MAKKMDFKIRKDHEEISYEPRVYELVNDRSLPYAISLKPMKIRTHATKGYPDDGLLPSKGLHWAHNAYTFFKL